MKFASIAVYERTFDTIILAQNLEDLFMNGPQGPYAVVTQYRFTAESRSRLREFTAKKAKDTWNYRHRSGQPTLTENIGWLYQHGSEIQCFFEGDLFEDDCSINGAVFTKNRLDEIWTFPDRSDAATEFANYLRTAGILLPKGYRPALAPNRRSYLPLQVDLKNRTARPVQSIAACEAYEKEHSPIPWTDLICFCV